MEETLLALLTGHLLGDFLFQTKWMVSNKNRWPVLLLHVGIITFFTFILLGNFHFFLLLGVFGSHLLFDKIKLSLNKDNWQHFALDQLAHFIALIVLSYACQDTAGNGWWPGLINVWYLPWFYAVQCLVSGVILAVPAGGHLIAKLTASISDELEETNPQEDSAADDSEERNDHPGEGLTNGGMYIGWLERLLTMILILIGHPTGIGFLIAAKSILRFGEIKESRHRKLAEYIIIGTFLSFGWALVVSVATQKSIEHWLPSQDKDAIRILVDHQ